jgi:SAM-dependent methyltransferase
MSRVVFVNDKRSTNRSLPKSLDVLDWLNVWEDSETYFDGSRDHGYGGYKYDGRWVEIVGKLKNYYCLNNESSMIDIGCAKGFLVNDYCKNDSLGYATGFDISLYALIQGKRLGMKGDFFCGNTQSLPFSDNNFDLAFCKDTLHNLLTREELLSSIKEIERISKNSWIRVAAYNTNKQKSVIDNWATFATCYFSVEEWHNIFDETGYSGDYDWFHPTDFIEDE